ncbi:Zinc knuckle CX2CX4HX4C [Corchorus capsularis]|uniref:Zinc knuckle CX2CX4HX4C n=1 Tax=Corchorus capsularis TaxID=210143 RepID=A0A1R3GBR0_COCAP|nr:Zinc knuckle CX2CX4HX4C [Corchorus capsularis]
MLLCRNDLAVLLLPYTNIVDEKTLKLKEAVILGPLWQKVEYEGLDNICFDCGCYGHWKGAPQCPKTTSPHEEEIAREEKSMEEEALNPNLESAATDENPKIVQEATLQASTAGQQQRRENGAENRKSEGNRSRQKMRDKVEKQQHKMGVKVKKQQRQSWGRRIPRIENGPGSKRRVAGGL